MITLIAGELLQHWLVAEKRQHNSRSYDPIHDELSRLGLPAASQVSQSQSLSRPLIDVLIIWQMNETVE